MLIDLDLPKEPELAILKVSNIFKVTPEFASHRLNLYYQKIFSQTRSVLYG